MTTHRIARMTLLVLAAALFGTAEARTTISGTVRNQDQTPLQGIRVRAFDEDLNADDLMAEAFTDSEGRYVITYTARDWDTSTFFQPSARHPDIYVRAERRCGDDFRRAAQSGARGNVRPSTDLTIDLTITVTGGTIGEPACCRISGGFFGFGAHCRGACGDRMTCIDEATNWMRSATRCLCALSL